MLAVGIPSSELPRPKPFTMGPERRRGKGGEGISGPAIRGRGTSGRIGLGGRGRKAGRGGVFWIRVSGVIWAWRIEDLEVWA